jgi:hypothetical protein
MKYITILALMATNYLIAEDRKPSPEKPQIEKPAKPKHFPKHWGHPPQIQVRDYVTLPNGFGKGSSTLASWITNKLKKDGKPIIIAPAPRPPEPKPPIKPKPNPRPEPPTEVKEKIDSYKSSQKGLQNGLREKLALLGDKPSREQVRKTVEEYRKDNEDLIASQKELGKSINDWHKDNRPERAKRPEPSAEIKEKVQEVKEKEKALQEVRKAFHEALKRSKDLSKEEREELIKEFKDANVENHKAVKEAQKELQKEIRGTKQDGVRRK